jgi:hypothetical protein
MKAVSITEANTDLHRLTACGGRAPSPQRSEDWRMWFPIPAIWITQGMSATAAGADRLGGHLVEEATRAQVDGAEDCPRRLVPGVIICWQVPRVIQVARTQGSRLRWVSSSASTTALGQPSDGMAQVGRHLLAIRVALGDQARTPPAGDLPDASTQRALAEGGSAKPLPQPADRPGLGLVQQPQDALVQAGAAQRWPARSGPVARPAGAVGL